MFDQHSIMYALAVLVFALLAVSSVMAGANFLGACGARRRNNRMKKSIARKKARRCLESMANVAADASLTQTDVAVVLENFRYDLGPWQDEDPLATLVYQALESGPNCARASISGWLTRFENGARNQLGFLANTAVLLGIAGTVIGLILALSNFATAIETPETFVAGFLTALFTTLWGIFIAVLARGSSSMIWRPLLVDIATEMTEATSKLETSMNLLHNAKRVDQQDAPDPADRAREHDDDHDDDQEHSA